MRHRGCPGEQEPAGHTVQGGQGARCRLRPPAEQLLPEPGPALLPHHFLAFTSPNSGVSTDGKRQSEGTTWQGFGVPAPCPGELPVLAGEGGAAPAHPLRVERFGTSAGISSLQGSCPCLGRALPEAVRAVACRRCAKFWQKVSLSFGNAPDFKARAPGITQRPPPATSGCCLDPTGAGEMLWALQGTHHPLGAAGRVFSAVGLAHFLPLFSPPWAPSVVSGSLPELTAPPCLAVSADAINGAAQ